MSVMDTLTPTLLSPAPTPPSPGASPVSVASRITIPAGIDSLAAYRRWAESDTYPESGQVSYLNGTIWVDPDMEEFLSHNQVKQAFNFMFGMLFTQHAVGRWVPDRMLLVNIEANLASEPDGLFYLWETMRSERLRMVPGAETGYTQLEGTPDGVLEIVSNGSVTKDLKNLRDLYWKAKIPEYWLVDARREAIRFDILRWNDTGYEPTVEVDGWLRSDVLGQSFRLERTLDPLGVPQFVVHVKPLEK
jgi:Uma2 family endonuclease